MVINVSIPSPDDLLPDPQVAQRYQVTLRTVARWDEDAELGFPKPVWIRNRKYRRIKELQSWERKRAAKNTRRPQKTERIRDSMEA
jgi:hypothetical protein